MEGFEFMASQKKHAPLLLAGLLLPVLLLGCPEDQEKPIDDDMADDDDDDDAIEYPRIEITEPQRACFRSGDPTVEVRGQCIAGTAPLDRFTVNGVEVDLDNDGRFSHQITASDGINIIELQCDDQAGERAVDALSFHFGDTHEPGHELHSVAVVQISPELLDDNTPDVDDTASLIEAILEDPSALEDLPASTFEYFVITTTSVTLSSADVDLTPHNGFLTTSISLQDVFVSFEAEGTGIWSWVEIEGTASVMPATVSMDLAVSAVGGNVHVEVQSSNVSLHGLYLEVEYVPDFLEPYLSSYVQSYIEEELQVVVEEVVPGFLAEYLDAISMEFDFLEDNPITLAINLEALQVTTHGITLELNGHSSAPILIELPDKAGSLNTPGAPPVVPFSSAPIAVALDDDFINQLMFAAWAGGHTAWTFSSEELEAMGGGDIPAPLGPVDSADVDILLPMVTSETLSSDFPFDMEVGEIRVAATRTDGEVFEFTIGIIGGAATEMAEDGTIKMTMEDRAAELTLGVGVLQCPSGQVPANMAALVALVVPPMLSQANDALDGFPLPDVDLSEMADIDYFAGKSLRLDDVEVSTAEGDGLWFLLEGSMAVY